MSVQWPETDVFASVREDLAPLETAYGPGTLLLPDGLEDLERSPLTNGSAHAVPWEYHVLAPTSRRGQDGRLGIVICGVTIVHGTGAGATFRRYIDWAGTWAQLGISAGRGEVDERSIAPPGLEGPDQPVVPHQQRLPVDGKIVEDTPPQPSA